MTAGPESSPAPATRRPVDTGPAPGAQSAAGGDDGSAVDVVVVGAGIAGLTAALKLAEEGRDVVVCEAGDRIGGKLWQRDLAGAPVDVGADSLLARHGAGVELASERGLELGHPATGSVQLLIDGRLRRLPSGAVLGAPTDLFALARSRVLSPLGLVRAATEAVWPRRSRRNQDRSVAAVVGDRFGHEVVERLVEPLLGGIYAGRPDRLSVRATTAVIDRADRRGHSLAHGLAHVMAERASDEPVFATPVWGMAALVTAVADGVTAAAGNDAIRTATPVTGIACAGPEPTGLWEVTTPTGTIRARGVIVAVPAHAAAPLLADAAPATATQLAGIAHASVGVVSLAFANAAVDELPEASGVLVPRREGRLVKAATWLARKWPHMRERGAVLRASVGRVDDHRWQELAGDELVTAVVGEVRDLSGITHDLADAVVTRWDDALPQYEVGHLDRIDRARGQLPRGMWLAGAAHDGIGVSPCIASGQQAALEAAAMLDS